MAKGFTKWFKRYVLGEVFLEDEARPSSDPTKSFFDDFEEMVKNGKSHRNSSFSYSSKTYIWVDGKKQEVSEQEAEALKKQYGLEDLHDRMFGNLTDEDKRLLEQTKDVTPSNVEVQTQTETPVSTSEKNRNNFLNRLKKIE